MSEVRERISSSHRRTRSMGAAGVAALAILMSAPTTAADCQFVDRPQFGGIEPPLAVNADCTDPDYNEKTFVLDSTEQKSLDLPDGSKIAYTEVKGHFPAAKTKEQLPPGITQSPSTVQHGVTWKFPDKA